MNARFLIIYWLPAYRLRTGNLNAVEWYQNPGLAEYLFAENENKSQDNRDQDRVPPEQEPSGWLGRGCAFSHPGD